MGFAALSGVVNYHRTGDPLTFSDVGGYLLFKAEPERLTRLVTYGNFNIQRL